MGNINDILEDYYRKEAQTRIATGGAQGVQPEVLGDVIESNLSAEQSKLAQINQEAEQKRRFNERLAIADEAINDAKMASNLESIATLGTLMVGKRGEIGKWFKKDEPAAEIQPTPKPSFYADLKSKQGLVAGGEGLGYKLNAGAQNVNYNTDFNMKLRKIIWGF